MDMRIRTALLALSIGSALAASSASGAIVFSNLSDNGFFTPFSSGTDASVRYGDGGWLSGFQLPTYTLNRIDLGLAVFGSEDPGSTDITFTFNDGDPSGLVFGSGAVLYSTTLTNVVLPASPIGAPVYFTLSIPLPNVETFGGFNNIGWSVGIDNYNYAGQFGFQVSTASGQTQGFYTNNASYYDGSSWSLFSFGPNPNTGVANYVATIYDVPEPTTLVLFGVGALLLRRRSGR